MRWLLFVFGFRLFDSKAGVATVLAVFLALTLISALATKGRASSITFVTGIICLLLVRRLSKLK
jgi:hypothetical protein